MLRSLPASDLERLRPKSIPSHADRANVDGMAFATIPDAAASQVSVRDLKTHLSEWLGRGGGGGQLSPQAGFTQLRASRQHYQITFFRLACETRRTMRR